MKERKYQTTDDVIARAASGHPAPPPARFRSKGWVVTGCILGGLIIVIGLALALGA